MTRLMRHAALGLVLAATIPLGAALGCPGPEPQLALGGAGGSGGAPGASGGTGGLGGVGGVGGSCYCPAVDFLFVVDNTPSIMGYVEALTSTLQAAPAMVEAIEVACSYHIGVVTPTPQLNNPEGCQQLGALSRRDANETACEMNNGRFLTEADHDEMIPLFGCLMIVGTQDDDDERPIESVFEAIGDEINASGGCNEGFFRPDAPLVTVIISDVDDTRSFEAGSGGGGAGGAGNGGGGNGGASPSDWYDNLLAIKGGNDDLLASVALLRPNVPGPSDGCPDDGNEPAFRLRGFVEKHKLDRRAILNICKPTADNLQEAVGKILAAVCPAPS